MDNGGCCGMKYVSSGTPQGGLGQFDIVDSIIGFATGLFSKDPSKVEYDRVRQEAWDSIANMVGQVDAARASNTLTRTMLQRYIDADTKLMEGFKAYTDKMLRTTDPNWVNPRFHDYYDFMGQVRTQWQSYLPTLPADWGGYIEDIITGGPSIPQPDWPNTSPVYTPIPTGGGIQQAGFDSSSMYIIGAIVIGALVVPKLMRKRG